MQEHKRHAVIWALLQPLVSALLFFKFNFKPSLCRPKGPFLVLSNHVTDWDPLFLGTSFAEQMYFIASEHVLRQGFLSRALKWLQPPIARQKGGSAVGAVRTALRYIKDGYNVALFPEGNRSWDGRTGGFPAGTGKLAKSSGATLVTFRLSGGYFASPRWAGSATRRGRVTGRIVNVYSPERLRSMSLDEINARIAEDIYEDAYAAQRREPVAFRGRRLAEHMETLLFTCPKCGAMHRMESRGNRFFCRECGMELRYLPTGFLQGEGLPFDSICGWNEYQQARIRELVASAGDEPIFSDSDVALNEIHTARSSSALGIGSMALYKDRLELPGGIVLRIEEITGMALLGANVLFIGTHGGRHLELRPGRTKCMVKYLTACGCLGSPIGLGV